MNVIEAVVRHGRCTGCGICAAVACECLTMTLHRNGYYVPQLQRRCDVCGICTAVCPGLNGTAEARDEPLGEVIATYAGYSTVGDERRNGASGGVVTRLLKALLERGHVDAVIVPIATGQSEQLFRPVVIRSPEEIERAASSKYYPIEFSSVLASIRKLDERVAVVGLPCVCTALRLAQLRIPWLRERLKYAIGLVCGHLVTTHYTSYLSKASGIAPHEVGSVTYRNKECTQKAHGFRFVAVSRNGQRGRALPYAGGDIVPWLWEHGLLNPSGCFHCSRLFATDASVTFMDAWLPDYSSDARGTSMIVVRDVVLHEVLKKEVADGRLMLETVSPQQVLASQSGPLRKKQAIALVTGYLEQGPRGTLTRWSVLNWRFARMRAHINNRIMGGGVAGRAIGYQIVTLQIMLLRALAIPRFIAAKARQRLRSLLAWKAINSF